MSTFPKSGNAAEVTKTLESFEIHDGDRIRIYPIVPYNQDTIYVEGHVVRPGRYSYRADMRVTDVISSYKDLLPEPATQYAEIIRLNAPDFHPSVEGFDLADALDNPAQAPVLHPMDTIRIFSRFDFENPPTVSVLGEVRVPGTYQTSGQIRLTDAVHLAGGLTPDAETGDAQVFRYLPDGKFKIFSVSLSQALAGDPVENILLQPRDRLLIHRNPDAVEPASVYIQGEVAKPGRYPLTTNMRVADLIRIGGGLKPSADTQTADLTRYQYADQTKLTGQHESIVALRGADRRYQFEQRPSERRRSHDSPTAGLERSRRLHFPERRSETSGHVRHSARGAPQFGTGAGRRFPGRRVSVRRNPAEGAGARDGIAVAERNHPACQGRAKQS